MLFGDFMRKNANILAYVEKYKYKYGISNLSDNDKLMKFLFVVASLAWVYAFFMTMLFILGMLGEFKFGGFDFELYKNSFFSVVIGAVVMIGGAVLHCLKKEIIASILVIASQPIMLLAYSHLMKDPAGQLNFSFYWRHAIPAAVLVVAAVLIMIIVINGIVKDNRLYNMLLDGIYKQYGKQNGEKLSEAEWQEFLNSYDPVKVNSIVDDNANN